MSAALGLMGWTLPVEAAFLEIIHRMQPTETFRYWPPPRPRIPAELIEDTLVHGSLPVDLRDVVRLDEVGGPSGPERCAGGDHQPVPRGQVTLLHGH